MTHEEKTLDKIRKLLALGEGQANENESAAAMKLASDLMIRHGITRDQLSKDDAPTIGYGTHFEANPWMVQLAHGVCKLYGVELIRFRAFDTRCFLGREDNVDAAEETFAYLVLQVDLLYRQHLPKGMSKGERAEYRRSFKTSCSIRVHVRCKEIVEAQQINGLGDTSRALVIDHRKQLADENEAFIKGEGMGAPRKTKALKLKPNRGTFEGIAAGDAVEIQRAVK